MYFFWVVVLWYCLLIKFQADFGFAISWSLNERLYRNNCNARMFAGYKGQLVFVFAWTMVGIFVPVFAFIIFCYCQIVLIVQSA